MSKNDTWIPQFTQRSPVFGPLIPACERFQVDHYPAWPAVADYARFLQTEHNTNQSGQLLRPVTPPPKAGRSNIGETGYEASIYLRGELAVYPTTWHDFFQILVWATFPRTKRALNAAHFAATAQRMKSSDAARRGFRENALTLFDENGAVILCSDPSLLEAIRLFRWKHLFWERRAELRKRLRCIVFGHALYEKALNPYVGMCAHGILLHCEQSVLDGRDEERLEHVDQRLAARVTEGIASPRHLSPFPLLGLPGWFDNDAESFYDNAAYFRSQRREQQDEAC